MTSAGGGVSPEVGTERLNLRPLPPAAASALPDNRIAAGGEIGAALHPQWPAGPVLGLLPALAALTPDQAVYRVWTIIERDTEMVVGDIGFKGPPGHDRTLEIGYSVVPDMRRRGYASEAAAALVAWGLRQPGVIAIVAECDEANQASIGTLERAGFVRTGRAAGMLRWRRS